MKIIKIATILFVLSVAGSNAFAETKQDCSAMESDTGVKIVENLQNLEEEGKFSENVSKIKIRNLESENSSIYG